MKSIDDIKKSLDELQEGLEERSVIEIYHWLKYKYEELYHQFPTSELRTTSQFTEARNLLNTEIIAKLTQSEYHRPARQALRDFYALCQEVIKKIEFMMLADDDLTDGSSFNKQSLKTEITFLQMLKCGSYLYHFPNTQNRYIREHNRPGHDKLVYAPDLVAGQLVDNHPVIIGSHKFYDLLGDRLKTAILNELVIKLNNCPKDELPKLIEKIKNSYEYQLLETRQHSMILSSLFKREGDACEELKRIFNEISEPDINNSIR